MNAPTTVTAAGNLAAEVRETHTGLVVLVGNRAYKAKKPVVTDFLDFSTIAQRERACLHEVTLNRRLAPDSYLGVAHVTDPQGGSAEPVIVMRRHPDSLRLASLATSGEPVRGHLRAIAEVLARFHSVAQRGPSVDAEGAADAVWARWRQNLRELEGYGKVVTHTSVRQATRMAGQFIAGRQTLFDQRIAERHIVDGHADLLADDIFCLPEGPELLDCLEFDDRLRYVDAVDDAAFLAMDLEFLGRRDLANYFLDQYLWCSGDPAPRALVDFYIAYRAIVRAKVDCVRVEQGHPDAAVDARRHIDIALGHLRSATVRLIIVGGGPGTGKTTLSKALAAEMGATVLSTDDVRRQLRDADAIGGEAGDLDAGLYSPENVTMVYDEVLRQARHLLGQGHSVVLDGTWRDAKHRQLAHELSDRASAPMVEFHCAVPIAEASARILRRSESNSDATPDIAAALAAAEPDRQGVHDIDTGRPLTDSVKEAQQICRKAV